MTLCIYHKRVFRKRKHVYQHKDSYFGGLNKLPPGGICVDRNSRGFDGFHNYCHYEYCLFPRTRYQFIDRVDIDFFDRRSKYENINKKRLSLLCFYENSIRRSDRYGGEYTWHSRYGLPFFVYPAHGSDVKKKKKKKGVFFRAYTQIRTISIVRRMKRKEKKIKNHDVPNKTSVHAKHV